MKPVGIRKGQWCRNTRLAPLRYIIIDRRHPAEELRPQSQGVQLLRRRNNKHVQRLMLLQIRELDTAWEDLLLKVQAQRDIIFVMLDSGLGQVNAVDFQDSVVVDHSPQERPGIELAFSKVDGSLGCEMAFCKFLVVLRYWQVIIRQRRDRESGPALRAPLGWDRDVDDGGRGVRPQIDPGVFVDSHHGRGN